MGRISRRIALTAAAGLAMAASVAWAASPASETAGDMSLGNPKAPVHVVEYASASCPHCAHFEEDVFPAFKAKYVDTGRVYYTLKEFLTPPPGLAAAGFLLARCGGPEKYFAILDGVFKSQTQWVSGADIHGILLGVTRANGVSDAQADACLNDQAALDALNARVRSAVEQDKVDSTPTFVINGERHAGAMTLADLDQAIAAAAKAAPKPKPRGRR